MEFGIIGTGAMGGIFGAHLAANGETVRCFDSDGAIVTAIQDRGLHVERPDRPDLRVEPEADTDATELGVVDVAFVFTKTIDTASAIENAEPMIDKETRLVTVQNGLGNVDRVAQYVARELLAAEGFTDVRYVELPAAIQHSGMARGEIDISLHFAAPLVIPIDAGEPITVLAGIPGASRSSETNTSGASRTSRLGK
jgi:2-dehydropantoate 2-reductase